MQNKLEILKVRSDEDDYLVVLRMAVEGQAELITESYLDGGVVERVYRVGMRHNPEITIGPGFFANALRDYSEWRMKWWRECVQNAVDAHASEIDLTAEELPNGNWLISCVDDGDGMSEDVLFNKFLTLGETGKEIRSGNIGGFGKAKELLILPWLQWRITSHDTEVIGSGLHYEVSHIPHVTGTIIEVIMPADQHTTVEAAMEFLQRCSISGVRITINGEGFSERLRTGPAVMNLAVGTLYRNKSKDYGECYIRARGLYMFTAAIFDKAIGTLIVELNRDTKEILTANRDGFNSTRYINEILRFIHELAIEGEDALKRKKGLVTEIFRGTGKIDVTVAQSSVSFALGTIPSIEEGTEIIPDENRIASVVFELGSLRDHQGLPGEGLEIGLPSDEIAQILLHEPLRGAADAEALAQLLVWQPDFVVHNEIEGFHVPSKFRPEKMGPRLATLAKVWAEACRWVFRQLRRSAHYGVGFVFSEDVGAAYLAHEGEDWLLFNPVKGGGRPGEIYSKSNRDDLKWIYAAAVHEVTHMADGYSAHDRAFAYALTANMAKTADGFANFAKIARSVKTEEFKKEPKEPKVAKSPRASKSKKTPVTLWLARRSADNAVVFYMHAKNRELVRLSLGGSSYTETFDTAEQYTVEALLDLARATLSATDFEDLRLGDHHEIETTWPLEIVRDLLRFANYKESLVDVYLEAAVDPDRNHLLVSILDLDSPVTRHALELLARRTSFEAPQMAFFTLPMVGYAARQLLREGFDKDPYNFTGSVRGPVKFLYLLEEVVYQATPL